MTPFLSQVLVAFLFTLVGFILGILATLFWFEQREKNNSIDPETQIDELPPPDIPILEKKPSLVEAWDRIKPIRKPQSGPSLSVPIKETRVMEKPRSIAEQVNEIFQDMLSQSELANRHIKLTESAHGHIVMWIDSQSYEEIENIPDEPVRQLIRQAAQKWNEKAKS